MALLPSIQPAEIPVRINFDFFFDRAGVASNISHAKRMGLWRAGSVVMQIARRSITKMGMAKPKLKIMVENPGVPLWQLHNKKGVTQKVQQQIRQRMYEIRMKQPSPAGKPPHTHGGQLRKSITYAYDPRTESVVIGGFMQGIERLVSLHEFGGIQQMAAWAWIPDNNGRGYRGIIGWWPVGRKPHLRPERWELMGSQQGESRRGGGPLGLWRKNFRYPARPYMQPALMEGIRRGRIPKGFGNSVTMTGMPGG
jgi:hypothetical protein